MKKVIILAVVIVAVLVFALFNQLRSLGMLEEDAYAITDDLVTRNLKSENLDAVAGEIELAKFNALDEIYERGGNIFVGQEKTMINNVYPLYVNDSAAVLNVNGKSSLINAEFEKVSSYFGLYVSDGTSFNADRQQADLDDFILLSLPNGIFVNVKNMSVRSEGTSSVALNSIISFKPEYIAYYEPKEGTLIYNRITGLDEDSWIRLGDYDYNYHDFLRKLGIVQDKPVPLVTPEEEITEQPTPIITPKPKESQPLPAPEAPVPPSSEVAPPAVPNYVKPVVTCEPFSAQVYGIGATITVYDPVARIKNGVRFELFRNGTELFSRKAVTSSGPFTVTPLPPDTTFKVVGTYAYYDENNRLIEETVLEQTIRTLPISMLEPMELGLVNGELFHNKIQVKDIVFAGSPMVGKDTVQYVRKIIVNVGDNVLNFDQDKLTVMKTGATATFETPPVLRSSTQYAYTFVCLDRYGNVLPLTKEAKGETATCKMPPKATLSIIRNEVLNNEIGIAISNMDNAQMGNCHVKIFNEITGEQIAFSADTGAGLSVPALSCAIPDEGANIKLPDLPVNTALRIRVYSDYDIEDNNGRKTGMEIGSLRLLTVDIKTLGRVFFSTTVDALMDEEARLGLTLDKARTHDILELLLTNVQVSAVNTVTGETDATVKISGQQLESLKAGTPYSVIFTGLASMTEYKLIVEAQVTYYDKIYEVNTYNNVETFKTMRKEPRVDYMGVTATANFIEIYNVLINDPDGALMEDDVALSVTDSIGRIIDSRILKPNTEYDALSFTKLKPNELYKFTFTAVQYNNGYDLRTYERMKRLEPVIEIQTIDGVSGKITLRGLGYEPQGAAGTSRMRAKLRVELDDKNNELMPPSGRSEYFLKVYRSGQLADTRTYTISSRPLDDRFDIVVDRYHDYVVELWVHLNNRDLKLDQVEFASDEPIIGLETIDDFAQLSVGTTAKYIVLDNINFIRGPWNYNANPFNGEIDFQGYTATFQTNNYLIYNMGRNGVLKNMVADITVTNTDALRYRGYLVYTNSGTISNVMINLKSCTTMMHNSLGLIARSNSSVGIIENFVVNIESPMFVRAEFGPVVYSNSGTIRNGCVYGASYNYAPEGVTSEADIIVPRLDANMAHSNNNIGGVVGVNNNQGRIENVYSLLNIKVSDNTSTGAAISHSTIGVVCGQNAGVMQNVYSVGEVRFEDRASETVPYRDLRYGPAVGSQNTRLQTNNAYYVSMYAHDRGVLGYSYENDINKKATRETLRDKYWQGRLLGNQFDTDVVNAGIFPLVKLPDSMPRQDNIALPALTPSSIELASVIVEQQFEDHAIAVFTFKNPEAHIIRNINLLGLDAQVMIGTQFDADDMSRVHVRISSPQLFVSAYTVLSFVYQELSTSVTMSKVVIDAPACEAEFFKPIHTVEQWRAINNSLGENYRLKADLDFDGLAVAAVRINSNYQGKLDGGIYEVSGDQMVLTGIHKISNISIAATSGTGAVFNQLSGTISNIRIENMSLRFPNSTYGGFVAQTGAGGSLDNVHVENASIVAANSTSAATTVHRIGSLVGYLNLGEMRNCSVNNSELIDLTHANVSLGGMVGYGRFARIENCYAFNLTMESATAQGARGTGGIVGYFEGSELGDAYAVGSINTVDQNTGGLIGYIGSTSKVLTSWADVSIRSTVDRMGGLIGFDTAEANTLNSLVVGDISSSVTGSGYIHRAVGSTTMLENTYAFEGQRINGQIPKDAFNQVLPDETTIASEQDLRDERYYTRQIRMGDAFDYSHVHDLNLPQLYYKNTKTLLPYQTAHKPQTPTIEIERLDARLVGTAYQIEIEFKHDESVDIENIVADYLAFVPTQITKVASDKTIYQGYADMNQVERYWDAYEMTGVEYNGGRIQSVFAQIDFGAPIYKNINNISDWKFAMKEEGRAQRYENFMLMGDLDFTGITEADAEYYDVKLNRLIGGGGPVRTIRNLNLNLTAAGNRDKCFINTLNMDICDIGFENVNISFFTSTDYNGIIGRHFGSVKRVSFKNITITGGRHYTGCFAFIRGDIDGVTVENFSRASTTGNYIGAFAGCVQDGSISNVRIIGQSGNEVSVSGTTYVGSMVGAALNTTCSNSSADYVKVRGIGNYVGGLIGYSTSPSGTDEITNSELTVTNSWIRGGAANYTSGVYTGGILGGGSMRNDTVNDKRSLSQNNTVIGYDRVGGASGSAHSWYNRGTDVENCQVFGSINVGGAYGYAPQAYLVNVRNCVISTIYDSLSTTAVSDGSLPIVAIPAGQNRTIGGVSGYRVASSSSVVNCTIGGRDAVNVGGLVGDAYEANTVFSHCTNSTVFGKENVGGIAGQLRYNRIYSCYTNSNVTASGNYAGGIVGYVIGNRVLHGTNLGYVDGCYTVNNTIKAANYAGGIFGYTTGQHDTITYANKALLSAPALVETTSGTNADFFGIIGNGSVTVQRSRVYEHSVLRVNELPVSGWERYAADNFLDNTPATYNELRWVSSAQLSAISLYHNRLASTFTNSYYAVNNSLNAVPPYMPQVRISASTAAVLVPNQIQIPIPSDEFALEGMGMFAMMDMGAGPQVLPEPDFYAVGADKLNIEFNEANEYTYYSLFSGEEQLLMQPIDRRVFTLSYDFRTPLTVRIGDGYGEEAEYAVSPSAVSQNVHTWGSDFYYTTGSGVQSGSSGLLAGGFVNIAAGEALSSSGTVYRLSDGSAVRSVSGISLEQAAEPVFTFNYNGCVIKTYKNFSTSEQGSTIAIRDFRMFVKNGVLTVTDATLPTVFDGMIIDAAGEEDYLTVLGVNGMLIDLKHPIKLPEGFKNSDIVQMSSNIKSTMPYVVVRYKDGSVAVFNYLAGELQTAEMVKSDMSLIEYAQSYFEDNANTLMTNAAQGYLSFVELKDRLMIGGVPEDMEDGLDTQGTAETPGTADKAATGAQADEPQGGLDEGGSSSETAGGTANGGGEAMGDMQGSGEVGLEKSKGTGYLAVFDMARGEYVVYDEAAMLGLSEERGDMTEPGESAPKQLAKDEPPAPLPVKINPETAEQKKTFFDSGNEGMILVLALIGVVIMMIVYIFDRRRKMFARKNGDGM